MSKENPNKKDWRTRIYKHVQKQERFTDEMKKEIEEYWELQFSEKLVWGKMHEGFTDRSEEWKTYRKKTETWDPIKIEQNKNVQLYSWVERKLISKKSWAKVIHNFTESELIELREIGFPV